MDIAELIAVLQGSIAPVILISSVGLLLLSMTNRLARPLDQIRRLLPHMRESESSHADYLHLELQILMKRCRILRGAIALCVLSIFFVSLVILLLFSTFLFEIGIGVAIKTCFGLCIVSLVLSLLLFLWDISLTLHSINIEVEEHYSNRLKK
ncbi:DUF2721 domain-containing protein [Maridesulfovibrio zosterae]|uniref:DUF2721 domain-containing protein n=1 Tax=Maridesulfovibrio zosterae TaxID=82171 RepID=UPI0003FDD902|nr:DUF2721 domain-containing protein [Maridesulfovibrio zosterae]